MTLSPSGIFRTGTLFLFASNLALGSPTIPSSHHTENRRLLLAQASNSPTPTPTETAPPVPSASPSPYNFPDNCPAAGSIQIGSQYVLGPFDGEGFAELGQEGTDFNSICRDAKAAAIAKGMQQATAACVVSLGAGATATLVDQGLFSPDPCDCAYDIATDKNKCATTVASIDYVCCGAVPQDPAKCEQEIPGMPNACRANPTQDPAKCSLASCSAFDSGSCQCTHCNGENWCASQGDCQIGRTCLPKNYKNPINPKSIVCGRACLLPSASPTATSTPTPSSSMSPSPSP